MWELERGILEDVSDRIGPIRRHLDFAGGTGRIAVALQQRCCEQIILDVSASMLKVAAMELDSATVLCRDFREGIPEIEPSSVDLVTCFRFFPNAEPELRDAAMAYMSEQLRPGGYLVCNNHRNFWSVPYITARALFLGGAEGMTHSEVAQLATKHGMRVVQWYSLGVLPQSEQRAALPWRAVAPLERALLRGVGSRVRAGYNVIYVLQRS